MDTYEKENNDLYVIAWKLKDRKIRSISVKMKC